MRTTALEVLELDIAVSECHNPQQVSNWRRCELPVDVMSVPKIRNRLQAARECFRWREPDVLSLAVVLCPACAGGLVRGSQAAAQKSQGGCSYTPVRGCEGV